MKKFIALILTTSLLGLTACNNSGRSFENSPDISDEISESTSSTLEENSSISEKTDSENSSNSDNSFPGDTSQGGIAAPDGGTLSKDDAVSADGHFLKFDHSYIRYAKPIFKNTLDDSELINWKTLEFRDDPYAIVENTNYFKVRAGDKLENGLTIKSAEYETFPNGIAGRSLIIFDGEIALEGILYCHPDDGYNVTKGQLEFWADATKCDSIPLPCGSPYETNQVDSFVDSVSEFAIICDGGPITVGNVDDMSIDLSGIIAPGEWAKAKITIRDLHKGWSESSSFLSCAELVSVEIPN